MKEKVVFLAVLGLMALLAHGQILAIDYGTMFIKGALVHTGAGKAFSIVENPKSHRKFINSMGIYHQERFYESDTLTKRSRGPSNCFIYSRVLVDMHQSPDQLTQVKKDLILDYIQKPDSDQLMAEFILSGLPEGTQSISLLETVAMMFRYIKGEAEKQSKGNIRDAVLTVPSHWSLQQRKFLVDAANLADLYVLSLIHENTAAALNYALSQRSTNDTEKVLFFNLGANSYQLSLAQFKQVKSDKAKSVDSVFMLGHYGQSYLGGLTMDSLIANFFVQKFEAKYKKTLNERGLIRLIAEAEKTKKVLSANKEATLFVEGIMDGIDFSASITRKQFEDLADETFQQLIKPIRRFLFDNDLKPEEITAVELIGGGARVPKIQQLLGETLGNASIVGSHINGDEAMVFGAAFYGANSSKKFKIKGINLYDGFDFDIDIVLRNADDSIQNGDEGYYFKNATLFKAKSRFGMTKEVTFRCRENLIVDLFKHDSKGVQLVASHKIDSIKKINETNFKISLVFEVHPLEVVKINVAKYLYQKEVVQSYTEKVRKVVPKNETKEQEEVEEKSDASEKEQEQPKDEQQDGDNEQQDKDQDTKQEKQAKSQKKKKKKKQKIEYETVERTRNVTKKYEDQLSFKQQFIFNSGQSDKVVEKCKKILSIFQAKELVKKRLAESKNKLEGLIYEVKERLENQEFMKYSKLQEKQALEKQVDLKNAWLDDTVSSDPEDYTRQFKQLSDPLDKIKKRILEHEQRDQVLKRSISTIESYQKETTKIRKGKGWITEEEVQNLSQDLKQAKQKVQRIYGKIKESAINEDSVHRNKDMVKEADIAKDKFFALKGKSKPKGWKDQKQQKAQKKEQSGEKQSSKGSKQDEVDEDEL